MTLVGGPLAGDVLAWDADAWIGGLAVIPVATVDARGGIPLPWPEILDVAVYRRSPLGDRLCTPFALYVGEP